MPTNYGALSPYDFSHLGLTTVFEEEDIVTLSEVVTYLEDNLTEVELWALCLECMLSLREISHCRLYLALALSPGTICISMAGNVCYLDVDDDCGDNIYQPPERSPFKEQPLSIFACHIYSLAMSLVTASKSSILKEEGYSKEMIDFITSATDADPKARPTFESGVQTCLSKLTGWSSRAICSNIASIIHYSVFNEILNSPNETTSYLSDVDDTNDETYSLEDETSTGSQMRTGSSKKFAFDFDDGAQDILENLSSGNVTEEDTSQDNINNKMNELKTATESLVEIHKSNDFEAPVFETVVLMEASLPCKAKLSSKSNVQSRVTSALPSRTALQSQNKASIPRSAVQTKKHRDPSPMPRMKQTNNEISRENCKSPPIQVKKKPPVQHPTVVKKLKKFSTTKNINLAQDTDKTQPMHSTESKPIVHDIMSTTMRKNQISHDYQWSFNSDDLNSETSSMKSFDDENVPSPSEMSYDSSSSLVTNRTNSPLFISESNMSPNGMSPSSLQKRTKTNPNVGKNYRRSKETSSTHPRIEIKYNKLVIKMDSSSSSEVEENTPATISHSPSFSKRRVSGASEHNVKTPTPSNSTDLSDYFNFEPNRQIRNEPIDRRTPPKLGYSSVLPDIVSSNTSIDSIYSQSSDIDRIPYETGNIYRGNARKSYENERAPYQQTTFSKPVVSATPKTREAILRAFHRQNNPAKSQSYQSQERLTQRTFSTRQYEDFQPAPVKYVQPVRTQPKRSSSNTMFEIGRDNITLSSGDGYTSIPIPNDGRPIDIEFSAQGGLNITVGSQEPAQPIASRYMLRSSSQSPESSYKAQFPQHSVRRHYETSPRMSLNRRTISRADIAKERLSQQHTVYQTSISDQDQIPARMLQGSLSNTGINLIDVIQQFLYDNDDL